MAPIVESIEIARRPEDVFAYVTDPDHLAEWQESVVSARCEGDRPVSVGSRVVVTRHVRPRDSGWSERGWIWLVEPSRLTPRGCPAAHGRSRSAFLLLGLGQDDGEPLIVGGL